MHIVSAIDMAAERVKRDGKPAINPDGLRADWQPDWDRAVETARGILLSHLGDYYDPTDIVEAYIDDFIVDIHDLASLLVPVYPDEIWWMTGATNRYWMKTYIEDYGSSGDDLLDATDGLFLYYKTLLEQATSQILEETWAIVEGGDDK